MKCIKKIVPMSMRAATMPSHDVIRVSDEVAAVKVRQGWQYTNKAEWKAAGRAYA